MKTYLIAISFLCAVSAVGQSVPPPCGEKGVPDNMPCYDAKSGKVIHTESPPFVPHQDIKPLPPPAEPGTIPTTQPTKTKPPDTGTPQVTFPRSTPTPPNDDSTEEPPGAATKSDNEAAKRQNGNYQAGYQVGQALGGFIYAARLRHAINKACFDKHARGWRLPSGAIINCSDWMKAHPRRGQRQATETSATSDGGSNAAGNTTSASGPDLFEVVMESHRKYLSLHPGDIEHIRGWVSVKNLFCQEKPDAKYIDLEGNQRSCGGMANQAYLTMEQLRKDIAELQPDNGGLAKMVIADSKSTWFEMKNIYCRELPDGKYTDLDGKEQSCNPN